MSKITGTALAAANLTEPQRLLVYRLWAEFKSPAKVSSWLQQETGVSLSPSSIKSICSNPEAMMLVQKFRDEFLMKVKEVPIANKRIRLEELESNRLEINEMKELVDIDKSSGRGEKLMMQRRMNETVCAAREEIEGKPLIMQQFNFSQYSSLSDEELQKRKEELLVKAKKVQDVEGMVIDV